MKIESQCLHEGYFPENGKPQAVPIYQSTTYKYESTEKVAELFDLKSDGFFYSRLANPTVDILEKRIAALEGGVGALCTCSGMSAIMIALINILHAGDHILSTSAIYGGSLNLMGVTLKRFGIDVTFIDVDSTEEEIEKNIRPNTKLIYGETVSNPTICVLDIEKYARIAHKNGIPLFVDNTFATPFLCNPIKFGADIVIHSLSKYMDGHAIQLGGVIVDSGKFNWANGKFPEFTEPDDSYHGVIYTKDFKESAYIVKARVQIMRDTGACLSAQGAFNILQGMETLPVRMERHCENADKTARFLEGHSAVESVNYPTLSGSKYKALKEKYLPKGASGVISFVLKGGREAGEIFIDSLKLISLAVHVADIRTCVLHPASSTHRQLTDKQLEESGVDAGMVRLSVGLENIDDIIKDLDQALIKSQKIR